MREKGAKERKNKKERMKEMLKSTRRKTECRIRKVKEMRIKYWNESGEKKLPTGETKSKEKFGW